MIFFRGRRAHTTSAYIVLSFMLLSACATKPKQPPPASAKAPVVTAPAVSAGLPEVRELPLAAGEDIRPLSYTVKKGDTLYSVARAHGYDYREVAAWNNIEPPYTIKLGQVLNFSPASAPSIRPAAKAEAKPLEPVAKLPVPIKNDPLLKTYPKGIKLRYSEQAVAQLEKEGNAPPTAKAELALAKPSTATEATPQEKKEGSAATEEDEIEWAWPATGKLIGTFQENSSLKGIDIAGKMGQPVFASAPGKVVYSGSGLRGYGKLIIIKHNKTFLSAYAHNNVILVKQGQNVVKGQKIAEMGNSDTDQVKLHFEIRRMGKPVDPLRHLPQGGA